MSRPTRFGLFVLIFGFTVLLGCDASDLGVPPRTAAAAMHGVPSVGRQVMNVDPHYLDRGHLEWVLSTPLRVAPAHRSDQLAKRFADTMAARTDRCSIRRIVHREGSNEVLVDLGLGCSQGSGVMRARFERRGDEHVGYFDFDDFWLSGNKLDGVWEVAALAQAHAPTGNTHLVSFRGSAPFEEIPAVAIRDPSSVSTFRYDGASLIYSLFDLTFRGLEALGAAAQ